MSLRGGRIFLRHLHRRQQVSNLFFEAYWRPISETACTNARTTSIRRHTATLTRVFVYNLPSMRKFIFILVLFLGAAFVYLSFGELENILETLKHGNIWFILLALLIQLAWFLMMGLIYRSLYQVFWLWKRALPGFPFSLLRRPSSTLLPQASA